MVLQFSHDQLVKVFQRKRSVTEN